MCRIIVWYLLTGLLIFIGGTLILATLAGSGTGMYYFIKGHASYKDITHVQPRVTEYYASPSNSDRTIYKYPFTFDVEERLVRETDGYLVPLLESDGAYLIQDCSDYYWGKFCPGTLLQYYTNINSTVIIGSIVRVYTLWWPISTKFNNTNVYSCSTDMESLPNDVVALIGFSVLIGAALLAVMACFFTAIVWCIWTTNNDLKKWAQAKEVQSTPSETENIC